MRYRILGAASLVALAACSDTTAPTAPALNPSSATAPAITLAIACEHPAVWAIMLDTEPVRLYTTLAAGEIRLLAEPGPHFLAWIELDPSTAAVRSHGSSRADIGRSGPVIPITCAA